MPKLTRYFVFLLIILTGLQLGFGLWLLYQSQMPPSDLGSAGEAIAGTFLAFFGALGLFCSSLALKAKGAKDRRIIIAVTSVLIALSALWGVYWLVIIPITGWVLYLDRQVNGS